MNDAGHNVEVLESTLCMSKPGRQHKELHVSINYGAGMTQ
jgi:hypothetical protein